MRHFLFLVALCLWSAAAAAQSQAEPSTSGGTFVTPGYGASGMATQRLPVTPGNGLSTPGTQPEVPALRTPATPSMRRDGSMEPSARRVDLMPPAKPSEFQKFVEIATGRRLQVFGSNFFIEAALSQGPMDSVPVSADYVIGPGDELIIRAWGAIDVDYRALVDRNGQIHLPKVGSFSVAGVKASDIERHLRSQVGRVFTNFNLNVTLGQLRGLKVFVVGPALRPGVYTLPSQSTMLSAAVAAGGPGSNGSMRRLLLRREGQVVSELDIYDFLVQGDKSRDVQLMPGDVVVFQPVGPRVALTGALETPAIYELKSAQEPLREVLRYAGGAPVLANPHHGQLERIDPAQPQAPRLVQEFKLDEPGLTTPLRDGDVVTLLEISPQFANAVTLKGHVAQPLRYPYTPGMRIRDLIPDKEALISRDFYRRKNMLVQVIEDEDEFDVAPRHGTAGAIGPRAGVRGAMQNGQNSATATLGGNQGGTAMQPPNGVAGAGSGAAAAGMAQPWAMQEPAQPADGTARRSRRATGVDDGTTPPGVRKPPAPLFDELNWDYAVIERLNRKDLTTQVIPFNLGRAILHDDPAHNIELLPGDVVTVYSQKDMRVPVARQTRLVSLEGEVAAPGVYQLLPGETLRSLLERAGGFSPQAYVYGLEFTREETRLRQRENLEAAVARLQALSATQAAREAANRRDETSPDRSAAISNSATQAQLARLAQLQPNGRIALELQPDTRALATLPDVPLEHGDRIVVPARPGFVTVAGAVANNNAYLWKPGRTAGDYVRLAGLDEAADRSAMFILRADGTVSSGNDRRGFFGFGGIESQPLHPGDAVVVPSQLDYETWGRALVRNLKDWSQIFYQFGLGAAAIQTLRNN